MTTTVSLRPALTVLLLVTLLAGTGSSPSHAQSPAVSVTWGPQRHMGAFDTALLSCPTERLCVFSSSLTRVARDPVEAGARWRTLKLHRRTQPPFKGRFVDTIVCASTRLCVGMGGTRNFLRGDAVYATRRPTAGLESYRRVTSPRNLLFPTCAGPSFCAAIGDAQSVFSRRPARKGSWVSRGRALRDANYPEFFSCSRAEACITGDVDPRSPVATIAQPLDGGAWRRLRPIGLGEDEFPGGGTCADARTCVFTTSLGGIYSAADITTATRHDWRRRDPLPAARHAEMSDVACPSADLCVAVGATSDDGKRWRSYLLSASAPFDQWTPEPIPTTPRQDPVRSISCPSEQLCVMYTTRFRRIGEASATYLLHARLTRTGT
jgi:hypothetical protein